MRLKPETKLSIFKNTIYFSLFFIIVLYFSILHNIKTMDQVTVSSWMEVHEQMVRRSQLVNQSISFLTKNNITPPSNYDSLIQIKDNWREETQSITRFSAFKRFNKEVQQFNLELQDTPNLPHSFKNLFTFIDKNYHPFISGGMAGIASWTISYPLDTLKTRIQSGDTYMKAINKGNYFKGLPYCLVRAFIVNGTGFGMAALFKKYLNI